jgi:hypothetical protein
VRHGQVRFHRNRPAGKARVGEIHARDRVEDRRWLVRAGEGSQEAERTLAGGFGEEDVRVLRRLVRLLKNRYRPSDEMYGSMAEPS